MLLARAGGRLVSGIPAWAFATAGLAAAEAVGVEVGLPVIGTWEMIRPLGAMVISIGTPFCTTLARKVPAWPGTAVTEPSEPLAENPCNVDRTVAGSVLN